MSVSNAFIIRPEQMGPFLKAAERDKGIPEAEPSDDITRRIIDDTHVRLAGFDRLGNGIDPAPDLEMLRSIEASEARYMDGLRAASVDTDSERDAEGLNEQMRTLLERFRTRGMHISHFSDAQREYIRRNGIIVFIEWEVREGVRVVLGALTALSRARWDQSDAQGPDGLWGMFPGYDMRNIAASDEDKRRMQERAPETFSICRSTVLPCTGHPLVLMQAEKQGAEIPEELKDHSTRRIGLGGRAKAVGLLIAQKFGMRYVTSNRAVIRYGEGEKEKKIENEPTTGFNKWGSVVGWRNREIPFGQPLVLMIQELASHTPLWQGLNGLIGERGIAMRKGHSEEKIRQEAAFWKDALENSIASGDHEPW